jgi:CopG antitoxin of type II toxin-antitoxin system
MDEGKSSISKAGSYEEMGAFWDTHDTADYWDQMETVEFDVDIQTDRFYFALEKALATKLGEAAHRHGVGTETLLNLWIQEKLSQENTNSPSSAMVATQMMPVAI